MDTGWSDLFVPSSKCADSYCDLHQLYDASLSSSYAPDGSPVQVHYGGLYTEGNVSQDTVRVADLQVLGQSFEEASLLRPVPLYFDNIFDTVLGLARIPPNVSRDSTLEARSLLQNIVDQGLLKRNNFALDLPRKDGEVGQLTLGVTADDKDGLVEFPVREISASDHALPDDLNAGWQVEASSVSLGDPSDPKSVHGPLINCTAVLASGYPFIDLPSDLHRSIKTRVNSDPDQYGTLDCNRRSSLPNLTVSLGPSNSSHGFTLTPWDYLLEVHFEDVGTRCLSTFTAHAESEGNYIVLGSAFLTGVYSIFDLDAKTISRRCPRRSIGLGDSYAYFPAIVGPSKRARVDTFDGSPSEQSLS